MERPSSLGEYSKVKGGYKKFASVDISVRRSNDWLPPNSRRSINQSIDTARLFKDPISLS